MLNFEYSTTTTQPLAWKSFVNNICCCTCRLFIVIIWYTWHKKSWNLYLFIFLIESNVIPLMTNDQLAECLPFYGDGVAVFGHCRLKGKESSGCEAKLFEHLRGRLSRRKGDCENVTERERESIKPFHTHPKNAQTNQRKIGEGGICAGAHQARRGNQKRNSPKKWT